MFALHSLSDVTKELDDYSAVVQATHDSAREKHSSALHATRDTLARVQEAVSCTMCSGVLERAQSAAPCLLGSVDDIDMSPRSAADPKRHGAHGVCVAEANQRHLGGVAGSRGRHG